MGVLVSWSRASLASRYQYPDVAILNFCNGNAVAIPKFYVTNIAVEAAKKNSGQPCFPLNFRVSQVLISNIPPLSDQNQLGCPIKPLRTQFSHRRWANSPIEDIATLNLEQDQQYGHGHCQDQAFYDEVEDSHADERSRASWQWSNAAAYCERSEQRLVGKPENRGCPSFPPDSDVLPTTARLIQPENRGCPGFSFF